jgi:hypothetical protein
MERFPLVESYCEAAEVSAVAPCPAPAGHMVQPIRDTFRKVHCQTPWMGSEVLA